MIVNEVETKSVLTKSNLPVSDYSVNPYTGCTHACKYCYACFMKRFTGHTEPWGTFLDVKHWPEIKHPALLPLYQEIYGKSDRRYWQSLDGELREFAGKTGLEYVTNDDSMKRPFGAPPIIVNYFYHSEIKKSARNKNDKG